MLCWYIVLKSEIKNISEQFYLRQIFLKLVEISVQSQLSGSGNPWYRSSLKRPLRYSGFVVEVVANLNWQCAVVANLV